MLFYNFYVSNILTARPNLTKKDNRIISYDYLKIYRAHYLFLNARPNQTTKEKTLSVSY
jgi:hypothetical protein